MAKRKFTRAEKMAYHSGKGYAMGYKRKGINFEKPNLRASFQRGYNKGIALFKKNPLKYPKLQTKSRKRRG